MPRNAKRRRPVGRCRHYIGNGKICAKSTNVFIRETGGGIDAKTYPMCSEHVHIYASPGGTYEVVK